MPEHERPDYMQWVTNNVCTFVQKKHNLVACVYCLEIYETAIIKCLHNCLVCVKCNIDAVMVVKHSPLNGLAEQEQKALLEEWHAQGFTPIEPK